MDPSTGLPEQWITTTQGLTARPGDADRIAAHWQADRALLDLAQARPDAAGLFDVAMARFDALVRP
ncbi:hypothetical protein GTZ99_15075 [Novosphingobium sp. FSY-8]|uniref:Uncharacterized protein n=1 Tax=Novosphingobium ovatum TaxID=1908523 RepID=A0ABW9XH98_9SPHN|nr:hypothetical protein [Novosphingobium ovatum]NBC37876.1 hypothetical protein [Novosphingobium ovatum]